MACIAVSLLFAQSTKMLAAGRVAGPRPFTAAGQSGRVAPARLARPVVVRAAEPEAPAVDDVVELMEDDSRGNRRLGADKPEFKHFLPLPLPSHLVYVKPTVAVVAGMASRSSVGLKMTAGDNQLERYVIEFYSKSVK